MTDENLEPVTPEVVEKNNATNVIIILAVAVVLCICICLCVLIVMPTVFGPIIGDVMSEVIDDVLLTPIY